MNKDGHIYALTDEEREAMKKRLTEVTGDEAEKIATLREDVGRLDGYLKGRAEADASKIAERVNADLTRRSQK